MKVFASNCYASGYIDAYTKIGNATVTIYNLKDDIYETINKNDITFFSYEKFIDNLGNIDVFGQALYNYYLVCFLLAGLILLVAMIGAIILTLNFKSKRKNELVFRQLSRSDNFISFFK